MSIVLLSACAGPGYYFQATSGQISILRNRQPIDELLADENTDPVLRQKLQHLMDIRQFATQTLHLPENNSYTQYTETGKDAVVWNVVATPEFSLQAKTWCFLITGCVPYRGYFKEESAQELAEKLQRKGMDTSVSPATAYSTLGWFEDPVLDTMLRYPDPQLAGIIFHELAHQQLYTGSDARFNESFAQFVEQEGVQLWLQHNNQQDQLKNWQAGMKASRDFNRLLEESYQELYQLYMSNQAPDVLRKEKNLIFEKLRDRYNAHRDAHWNGRDYYSGWFQKELNNARMALISVYQDGVCAFDNLFTEAEHDWQQFYLLAKEKTRLPAARREQWLGQPCRSDEYFLQ